MCRPKDQTEPEYLFEISLLPSCESTFSNFFTNILRFGGVNKNNRVNKCVTWKQWWKSESDKLFVLKKRDVLNLSRSNKKGFSGGGGAFKRQALHVNDRPRPGFDYVDEEYDDDDKGNNTTHETLSANNNNLTTINNRSEIVLNGTMYEGV